MNFLTTLLRRPAIGWWDLVDIVVVSLLIYELLKLIKGTRAVQMGFGGAILAALFYLSRGTHLETMNWLVRNLAGYIVFAVIVLFQSDIRRALAHFGRAPFFRYFAKPETEEESIEELVVAAGMLAAQQVGAIVAVERQIGLRNYIEGGIPLDAVLTYDLIVSIFQPQSPLHDGAVIVQGDRVAAAACFLPLTVNPKLSKELGSRHRAAIGLTEENDALAIVVSEETGSISLVVGGEIERGLQPDVLRSRLRGLAIQRRPPARRREVEYWWMRPNQIWPFRNFGLKLLSVGLAVLLWLVVAGEETVERGLRVPLEFQQIPAGLEMQGEPPSLVDVRVRGSSSALGRMSTADVAAVLDLHAARPGYRLFQLIPEQVRVPFGVEVLQVNPTTVAIVFENSTTRRVKVVPAIEGEPAPGFVIGPVTSDPPQVEVIGPETAVGRAMQATTEPVSVAGARDTVNDIVTVGLLDPALRVKSPQPATVRVRIQITRGKH